jgi:PKD repeat protein
MSRIKLTIDRTKVSGSLTNFPVLFTQDCVGIPSSFWTDVIDPNGLDIRFFDTNGTSELKREIVFYDAGTNKVEAWIQVPSLTNVADKVLWCEYGGSTLANDVEVWTDINATSIFHFTGQQIIPVPPTIKSFDSITTNSPNYATIVPDMVQVDSGKIGKAYDIPLTSGYGSISKVVHSGVYTVSAWAYLDNDNSADQTLVIDQNINSFGLILSNNTAYIGGVRGNIGPGWAVITYIPSLGWWGVGSGDVYSSQFGAWHRITGVFDGDVFKIYVDGVLKATSVSLLPFVMPSSGPAHVIGQYLSPQRMYGTIDELDFYSDAKSSSWIATEYENQNSPETFIEVQSLLADFTYEDTFLDVQFTDTSVSPATIISWLWDFGDGDISTDQNPDHVYAADGTYDVVLYVSDDNGSNDSITIPVTVASQPVYPTVGDVVNTNIITYQDKDVGFSTIEPVAGNQIHNCLLKNFGGLMHLNHLPEDVFACILNENPEFTDVEIIQKIDHVNDVMEGDFKPRKTTPCLDMGDNSFVSDVPTDVLGDDRIYDDGIVDIGPYELTILNIELTSGDLQSIFQEKLEWDSGGSRFLPRYGDAIYNDIAAKMVDPNACEEFAREAKIVIVLKKLRVDYKTRSDKLNDPLLTVEAYYDNATQSIICYKFHDKIGDMLSKFFEDDRYVIYFNEAENELTFYLNKTYDKGLSGHRNVIKNVRFGGSPVLIG